ncbi:metallophosphoesterase family protein [Melioribacter sp. OK-6-Me]|uniref:metallophosphoesterase family protein n=1 Tax=unclassified Melioribacter TaxID=2627329 RepID=UPI003EDB1177
MVCFHVSDLHGRIDLYDKLFFRIIKEKPNVILIGGDILPHGISSQNFITDYFKQRLIDLRKIIKNDYPKFLLIMGNDDPRRFEKEIEELSNENLISYLNLRKETIEKYDFYGYSYVPPTPFRIKDWDKYDVSRYTEPGCISPEDGYFTIERDEYDFKYSTIKDDLRSYLGNRDLSNSIILFHTPPYNTKLDVIKSVKINHLETDKHVGSIAVRKLIEIKQPLITLHGHIHESSELSGSWSDRIGRTYCFNASYHKSKLSLIRFDPAAPEEAVRILI